MNTSLREALQTTLARVTSQPATIRATGAVGGGCIHAASWIELDDGRRYFVKSNAPTCAMVFEAEAIALEAIRATATIRVPAVVCTSGRDSAHADSRGAPSFLVLEWLEKGRKSGAFEEELGRQLARMHATDVGDRFGFPSDNWLGATEQRNASADATTWTEFWAEFRLGPQLDLALANGHGAEIERLGRRILERLDERLEAPPEAPALLHGDLWSGNCMALGHGEPALVDPACYFGHREAEFGMISLFGGLSDRFDAAYREAYPLADGAADRIAIYRLYHLLNHLNLFGRSYLGDCVTLMRHIVG